MGRSSKGKKKCAAPPRKDQRSRGTRAERQQSRRAGAHLRQKMDNTACSLATLLSPRGEDIAAKNPAHIFSRLRTQSQFALVGELFPAPPWTLALEEGPTGWSWRPDGLTALFQVVAGLVCDGSDSLAIKPVGQRLVHYLWSFFRIVDRALRLPCPASTLEHLTCHLQERDTVCFLTRCSLLRLLLLHHLFSPLRHLPLNDAWRALFAKLSRARLPLKEFWQWDVPRLRRQSWLLDRFSLKP